MPRPHPRFTILMLFWMASSLTFGVIPTAQTSAQIAATGTLDTAFGKAATEFDVPRDLLVAIAYAETHLDDHNGEPSIDNGYGVMHLVDNPQVQTLKLAADQLGVAEEKLKTDTPLNIRGGAAVLRAYADQQSLSAQVRKDPAQWYQVVARYSNATDDSVARLYADEVFRLLNEGIRETTKQNETISIARQSIALNRGKYEDAGLMQGQSSDYGPALWVEAHRGNYTVANRPADGNQIKYIVIHTTEGSYSSAINWFKNDVSDVSAHYVIRSSDGQITQMVREKDIAWHAGYWSWNAQSIGLEHEAYANNASWFTDAMYRASAALTRNIALKYNIPMDRTHIIGHSEFKSTKGDPGPYWNWNYYMQLVRQGAPTDNGDSTIDEQESRFAATGSWNNRSCGYASHAYWTHATNGSEGVPSGNTGTWRPNLPHTGQYKVRVHIPQGCGIASPPYATTNARYEIRHAGGTARATVDQNTTQQWVDLGTFQFNAGTSSNVYLTDLTSEPYSTRKVVFFDAIEWIYQAPPPPPLPAPSARLDGATLSRSSVSVGEVLKVQFTVRNDGNVALETQAPGAGSFSDDASGWVYDEAECFLGNGTSAYPAYPKESGKLRVTLGFTSGSPTTGSDCSSSDGGFPWRWGVGGQLRPGESRQVLGYVRFRTPGTYTLRANLINENVKYYGADGNGLDRILGTITVMPEGRAPELVQLDEAANVKASVYQLTPMPNSLLERTSNPLSIVEGAYIGTFNWDGGDQNWGGSGPLSQNNRFVIRQVRTFVAPTSGTYRFRLTSDDGSWLWVDGRLITSNPGLHPASSRDGSTYLSAGVHTIAVKFFENGGDAYTGYAWMPPNENTFTTIPVRQVPMSLGARFKLHELTLIGADDLGGSGLRMIRYWIDGGSEQQSYSGRISLSLSTGSHTVMYEAEDNNGNRTSRARASFTIDPNLTITQHYIPMIGR